MKTIILILTLLPILAFAEINVDSLKRLWSNEILPDTTRLSAIHEMIKCKYLNCDADSALYFSKKEYEFAKSRDLKKDMANAMNYEGISYSILGDYIKALESFNQCLEIRKEIDDKNDIACTLNNIAIIYMKQGDYANSINYHNQSLLISEEINARSGIIRSLLNIALIYTRIEDYSKALEYNLRSIKISEEIGENTYIGKCYNNIGNIYAKQEKFNEALDNYQQSLNFQKNEGNILGIGNALGNIGVIYHHMNDYTKAMDFYKQSLLLKQKVGSKENIAMSLNNIGIIFQKMGNLDSAIYYNKNALKISQEVGAVACVRDVAESLYLCYKGLNYNTQALKMHELYVKLKDSLQSLDNHKEVIRQEYKYIYRQKYISDSIENLRAIEIGKKEMQVEALQARTRNYFIFGVISILVIVFGLVLKVKSIKIRAEKDCLLKEINTLKSAAVVYLNKPSELTVNGYLDRKKIELYLRSSLNDSDWNVLNELFDNPTINNRDISETISLSYEGVRSSLKKMYRIFNIQNSSENQRIALIVEAIRISTT